MLENMSIDKSTQRTVYVLSINEEEGVKTFKLGRGQDQDIKINDITVSRCHAMIVFRDDHFVLEDNLSKFGTLLLIKDEIELLPGQIRKLQIGKTVLSYHMSF